LVLLLGIDPNIFPVTLALQEFLTLNASFPSRFDPGAGAGKLPALRADVTGQASLVTAALYPAFLPSPVISSVCWKTLCTNASTLRHRRPTAAF